MLICQTEAYVKYYRRTKMLWALGIIFGTLTITLFIAFIALIATEIIAGLVNIMLSLMAIVICAAATGVFLGFLLGHIGILNLYNAYSKVLYRDPDNAVDMLGECLGLAREEIVDNFIALKDLGFFDKIFIDEESQVVNACKDLNKYYEYVCPICGGTTLIQEGKPDICGFCGTLKEK